VKDGEKETFQNGMIDDRWEIAEAARIGEDRVKVVQIGGPQWCAVGEAGTELVGGALKNFVGGYAAQVHVGVEVLSNAVEINKTFEAGIPSLGRIPDVVEEGRGFEVGIAFREDPRTVLPCPRLVLGPGEAFIDVGPGAVLAIDPGVENSAGSEEAAALALFWKNGWCQRVFATIDVDADEVLGGSFDARKA